MHASSQPQLPHPRESALHREDNDERVVRVIPGPESVLTLALGWDCIPPSLSTKELRQLFET